MRHDTHSLLCITGSSAEPLGSKGTAGDYIYLGTPPFSIMAPSWSKQNDKLITNVNFLLYTHTNLSCRANVTVTDLITFASLISQFVSLLSLFSSADFHLFFTINFVLSRKAFCETVPISDSGFGVHVPFKLSIVCPRTTFNVCFVENYVRSYVIQNLFQ